MDATFFCAENGTVLHKGVIPDDAPRREEQKLETF